MSLSDASEALLTRAEYSYDLGERCIGVSVVREGLAAIEGRVAALESALRDVRSALVSEHGHDGDAYAPWPSCLPVHIALNRARAALSKEGAKP